MALRRSVVALMMALSAGVVACSDSKPPSTPDAASACPTAYERITAEDSGHELAVAYREHVPTPQEKVMAAALYAVLIRAAKENTLDVDLFRRLAAAGTLSPVPGLYPTAFRTCGGAVTAKQAAVISDPFQCTDDCLVSPDQVFGLLIEQLVRGLRLLGAQSMVYMEALNLTNNLKLALADPGLAGQQLQNAALAAISQDSVGAFLTTVFDAIGKSVAITAALAEIAGAAEVAPALAATGTIIAMGVYAVKLQMLANRITACQQWKLENCSCMGPNCGCAELGASSRGVMCCAQGGPTSDGGWYVITASPTCCVLNRAEYGKHSQLCYAPPDKTPGPCPSCLSDAECCDRTGAPGNVDHCVDGRCCGREGPERPNTATMVDFSCCSGVRYMVNSAERTCAPAP